jgi:hypothetical protein
MKTLLQITIPKFAKSVTVSKARRANYYHQGEKIPKKYNNNNYAFVLRGKNRILCDIRPDVAVPVIKNPKTAGTPRVENISGNSVWDTMRVGNYMEIIKLSVQNYFWEVIKHFELNKIETLRTNAPLRVHFEFYTHKEEQDIDNLDLIYRKAFLDAITDRPEHMVYDVGERLIPTDGPKMIKSIYTDHYDCELDDEKLIITISKCDNTVINYENFIITNLNINDIKRSNFDN